MDIGINMDRVNMFKVYKNQNTCTLQQMFGQNYLNTSSFECYEI